MRLDKYLCELNIGTRSQVKDLIRQGLVTVNGQKATSPEQKIAELTDAVAFQGKRLSYRPYTYYMMNKPAGVISATKDPVDRTVLDVLRPWLRESDQKREIVPAGRLDRDTEGLLLLTDDGELIHRLLSPKKHVDKTYLADLALDLTPEAKLMLEQGVEIGEKAPTLPAVVEQTAPRQILLTIREGKFHQVKRMLQAVGNEVTGLKRLSFGSLKLDPSLKPGECRELTDAEIAVLTGRQPAAYHLMEDVEAVIFDMDGTLIDSMWLWRDIDIEYLGKFGIELPENLQACIEGMSFHETALYFKEHFAIPDSIEQMKADWNAMAWDKYEREVPLKSGAREFLDKCRERGILLGIATSNSTALVENIAAVHGLHDYFQCIRTGTEIEHGKPAPDIYLAVADALHVAPEKCLVFEDIIPGIQAGKNAGMRVCAVEDAYSADTRIRKRLLADYYIDDYTQIPY